MNYKKWLIEDLQDLGRLRFACGQLRRELDTIDAEIAAIECGPETAERKEWLLDARARWVDVDVNLKATEMHVADMEALLAGLPDEERTVVQAMFVDAVPGAVGDSYEFIGNAVGSYEFRAVLVAADGTVQTASVYLTVVFIEFPIRSTHRFVVPVAMVHTGTFCLPCLSAENTVPSQTTVFVFTRSQSLITPLSDAPRTRT